MSQDQLVDRDCVILDGTCNCKIPSEDCKYLKEWRKLCIKDEENKKQIRRKHKETNKEE